MKVCLILYYIGKLPDYFRMFEDSCFNNPEIDFIFFSDQYNENWKVKNIAYYQLPIFKFNEIASKKLGFELSLQKGYKLIDIRPAFGCIFEDYLKGYDFWGQCDPDIIFGKIRNFLTDEVLTNYDIYTTREHWTTGHFTIYRNKEPYNKLFQLAPGYQKIFQDNSKEWFFEESCRRWEENEYSIDYLVSNNLPVSMYDVVKDCEKKGILKAHFRKVITEGMELVYSCKYEKGIMFDLTLNCEILYFHLIESKSTWRFYLPNYSKFPDCFFIKPRGICLSKEARGIGKIIWELKWFCNAIVKNLKNFRKLGFKYYLSKGQ